MQQKLQAGRFLLIRKYSKMEFLYSNPKYATLHLDDSFGRPALPIRDRITENNELGKIKGLQFSFLQEPVIEFIEVLTPVWWLSVVSSLDIRTEPKIIILRMLQGLPLPGLVTPICEPVTHEFVYSLHEFDDVAYLHIFVTADFKSSLLS